VLPPRKLLSVKIAYRSAETMSRQGLAGQLRVAEELWKDYSHRDGFTASRNKQLSLADSAFAPAGENVFSYSSYAISFRSADRV
jgi:hypothetical protein